MLRNLKPNWLKPLLLLALTFPAIAAENLTTKSPGRAVQSNIEGHGEDQLGQSFVLANMEFALLHELSHMVIEELELPILGMEEDAADRIAIISGLLTRRGVSDKEVIPWLFAVAGDWYAEWELRDSLTVKTTYWSSHRLEIQRFHNMVCLVYGSDPKLFHELLDTEVLPFERAMWCDYEYEQAHSAFKWVMGNYGNNGGRGRSGHQIKVTYKKPQGEEQEKIVAWVKESKIPEEITQRLSGNFQLPRDILVEFDSCESNPNAYWHAPSATVTICYDLLSHFLAMAGYLQENPEPACKVSILRNHLGGNLRCQQYMAKNKSRKPVGAGLR